MRLAPADDTYVFVIGDFGGGPAKITEPGTLAGPGATGPYQFKVTVSQPGAPIGAGVTIQQGRPVLIQVTTSEASSGDFSLSVTNLDQFSAPDANVLLFAGEESVGSVEAADLNGDGHIDVVRTGRFLSTVEVLLGNGDGTFQAPREFRVGPVGSKSLRVADVSGDGIADVIVSNAASADVSVLLGRGDGTLDSPRRFDATATPFGVEVGDFDGDGALDLAVGEDGNIGGASFAILKGRGDGTFTPAQFTQLQPRDAVPRVADFNGDGLDDLALFTDIPGGGAIVLSNTQTEVFNLTADIRAGASHFTFNVINSLPTSVILSNALTTFFNLINIPPTSVAPDLDAVGGLFAATFPTAVQSLLLLPTTAVAAEGTGRSSQDTGAQPAASESSFGIEGTLSGSPAPVKEDEEEPDGEKNTEDGDGDENQDKGGDENQDGDEEDEKDADSQPQPPEATPTDTPDPEEGAGVPDRRDERSRSWVEVSEAARHKPNESVDATHAGEEMAAKEIRRPAEGVPTEMPMRIPEAVIRSNDSGITCDCWLG